MGAVVNIISHIYAALSVVPFASFFGVWFLVFFLTRDKKRSTAVAVDCTFVFLLGANAMLTERVFGSRFGFWLLVLILLVAAGWVGREQNRLKGRIDILKILKVVARGGFLLLSLVYFVLMIVSIGQYVAAS